MIHPNHVALTIAADLPTHKIEEELRISWWERAQLISQNKNGILIEFSTLVFDHHPFEVLEYIGNDELFDKIQLEVLRVNQFKEMLGDKYFLFGNQFDPKDIDLLNILKDRNFQLSQEPTILGYGQYLEACVDTWTLGLVDELKKWGLSPSFFMNSRLSLDNHKAMLELKDNVYYSELKNFNL